MIDYVVGDFGGGDRFLRFLEEDAVEEEGGDGERFRAGEIAIGRSRGRSLPLIEFPFIF